MTVMDTPTRSLEVERCAPIAQLEAERFRVFPGAWSKDPDKETKQDDALSVLIAALADAMEHDPH